MAPNANPNETIVTGEPVSKSGLTGVSSNITSVVMVGPRDIVVHFLGAHSM